ncbi:phage tail protein [Nitrosomonas nitrosa]|uniref:phage tail protein n=1 Tax=Nitrosomonas nitrosa TaxID=52442 RepID=UPI0023F7F92A|nr:phage tail protein [Nitrosomonas nitrosa]MCO6434998.1 phage tail protein [Nitrosomonas nitrosa]
MAVQRDNPYGAFNFRVTVDRFGGNADATRAGFQEISGLGLEVTEAEYRNGNEMENHVRKISGIYKATDVTLKRGIIGWTDFYDWIKDVRQGAQNGNSQVTIELMDEARTAPVMTWILINAKPKSYKGATLNGKGGTDVAMEELVLSCEKMNLENAADS